VTRLPKIGARPGLAQKRVEGVVMEHVELDVAADPSQLSLPRLLIGAVGALVDLSVDHIDDLQLAMDELCVSVMAAATTARERLHVTVLWDTNTVRVEVSTHGQLVAPLDHGDELTAYSRLILDALVDEHGVETRETREVHWFRLTKRTDSGAA
jgi:hypothetical protein